MATRGIVVGLEARTTSGRLGAWAVWGARVGACVWYWRIRSFAIPEVVTYMRSILCFVGFVYLSGAIPATLMFTEVLTSGVANSHSARSHRVVI